VRDAELRPLHFVTGHSERRVTSARETVYDRVEPAPDNTGTTAPFALRKASATGSMGRFGYSAMNPPLAAASRYGRTCAIVRSGIHVADPTRIPARQPMSLRVGTRGGGFFGRTRCGVQQCQAKNLNKRIAFMCNRRTVIRFSAARDANRRWLRVTT
jgi:hypothetical protein